jgi:predicted amidophosphoribosyltransferase
MLLQTLEFGSLLTYFPRGTTAEAMQSKTVMARLKNDQYVLNPPILMSDWVADEIKRDLQKLPFRSYFTDKTVLVPAPSSGMRQSSGIWPAQRIAIALAAKGLAMVSVPCLSRVEPVPKSATSFGPERPKAERHYETMAVQKGLLSDPEEIVLVDDVITRGATILGGASRLHEAFPKTRIRAFAAMRTMTPPSEFEAITDPCIGTVRLMGINTYRRP